MTKGIGGRGLVGKLLLAAASLTIMAALTAGAGEVAVRYRERHRTSVPGTMPLLYYRHGLYGYALVRDYDYFGWVHINRYGFRGPDMEREPGPGVMRVMVVGGSTTFDSFVTGDERTWPARLQYWLGQLAPDRPVEVINAGVPGYRVRHNLLRLESELYAYRPDVIILYHTHNDLFAALRSGTTSAGPELATPGEIPTVTPWGRWVTRHSLLYSKLVGRLQAIGFRAAGQKAREAGPPTPADSMLARGSAAFAQDLQLFLVVARTLDIPVVLPEVTQISGVDPLPDLDTTIVTMWRRSMPFTTPDMVLAGYRRFGTTVRAVAESAGVPFISTAEFGIVGAAYYYPTDPIHFNDAGADRMGRAMAEALIGRGILASLEAADDTLHQAARQ